jgi:hypothetical protein
VAFNILQKRCEDCRFIYFVRKPNHTILIVRIVAGISCPICHPEALATVCGGCHLPWNVVKYHSNGCCNACVVREYRASRMLQTAPA